MKNKFFFALIICSFFILKTDIIFSSNIKKIELNFNHEDLAVINNFLFPKNIFDFEASQVSFRDFLGAMSGFFKTKEDYHCFLSKLCSSNIQSLKKIFLIKEFEKFLNLVDIDYLNDIIISRLAIEYLIRYLGLTEGDDLKLKTDLTYTILVDENNYTISFYKNSNLESLMMAIFIGVCATNDQMIQELGESLNEKILRFLYSYLLHFSPTVLERRALKYLPETIRLKIKSTNRSKISVINFLIELSKIKGNICEVKRTQNKYGFSPRHLSLITTVKKLADDYSLLSY